MTTNNDSAEYRPIACDTYSELELAIIQRTRLRLVWRDQNVIYDRVVLPLDLRTREHAEYLLCRLPDGAQAIIRLDHIKRMERA